MKIFVTGATGYIGSAVAAHLARSGHEVTGLTRSAAKAERLAKAGVKAAVGDLKAPRSYEEAAGSADAVIHAGFEYGPEAGDTDRFAVDALIACARRARAPRLLIYTSGVWVLGPRPEVPAEETAELRPPRIVSWRPAVEKAWLDAADDRISTAVIRPGCVYGERQGLYGLMIESLYDRRRIRLVAGGRHHWASVYLGDLAELYRLVLEKRPRREIYHATDGGSPTLRETAEALIEAAGGGELEDWAPAEAERELGALVEALAMDQRVSSEKARRQLGWRPSVRSSAESAELLIKEWHEAHAAPCVA